MKDIEQYGLLRDDEWVFLPWLPSPRPPFDIWVKSEDIAQFFFVQHYPIALSLLLRIGDSFKVDIFHKLGLEGSSKDWEILTRGIKYGEQLMIENQKRLNLLILGMSTLICLKGVRYEQRNRSICQSCVAR